MDVLTLEGILKELGEGAKPVGEIAKRLGIGWKTCEKYLEGLKMAGVVVELRTPKERIFMLRRPRRARLLSVPRVRVGATFESVHEEPPRPGEVEDLT
ncbi:MAG: winged helix-turn-helix domain-containing protein [Candidatus Bathyarchaeia archaeon]